MICSKCKKVFDEPIMLFNGEWRCPICTEKVFPDDSTLVVNGESYALFSRSEETFYNDYVLANPDTAKDEKLSALSSAIELCRQAALLKNPYALLKLGYYYSERFINDLASVSYNRLAAIQFYNVIANASKAELITSAKDPSPLVDFAKIQAEAKKRIAVLKDEQSQSVKNENESTIFFMDTVGAMKVKQGKSQMFGVFKLDKRAFFDQLFKQINGDKYFKNDFQSLIKTDYSEAVTKYGSAVNEFLRRVATFFNGVEFGIFSHADGDFKIVGGKTEKIRRGNKDIKYNVFFREQNWWGENGEAYAYLYNVTYKAKDLKMKEIHKQVQRNDTTFLADKVKEKSDYCLFSYDDIYYQYRKSKGYDKIFENLIKDFLTNY